MRLRCAVADRVIAAASALFILSLILASLAVAAGPNFPKLTGRVVDEAGILSPQTRDLLSAMSADQERSTGNQIVVITVKSLQGYSIEDFGYQLGRYWGIGQKGRNNGVILLVAPNERKVRIEVGYGLEGTLTDAKSRIIIDQSIVPAFRQGHFNGGVLSAMQAMLLVLGGNPLSAETSTASQYQPFSSLPLGAKLSIILTITVWCIVFFGGWGYALTHWSEGGGSSYSGGGGGGGFSGGGGGGGGGGGFSGGGGSFGGGGASGSW